MKKVTIFSFCCLTVVVVFIYCTLGFGTQSFARNTSLETFTVDCNNSFMILGTIAKPFWNTLGIFSDAAHSSFYEDNKALIQRIELHYGVMFAEFPNYWPDFLAYIFDPNGVDAHTRWMGAYEQALFDSIITDEEFHILYFHDHFEDVPILVG